MILHFLTANLTNYTNLSWLVEDPDAVGDTSLSLIPVKVFGKNSRNALKTPSFSRIWRILDAP